ncbi:MAG: DUF1576 domain-containing protein [Defluviitaleaceae bacterium]|nr:DUF1576 domain-containing protein [Defluviitaleaceae bacterium]
MTKFENTRHWLHDNFLTKPYRVQSVLFLFFIAKGFFHDTPQGILLGLFHIVVSPDILVTDYIVVGGFGAALVNAGLSGLVTVAVLALAKHEPLGLTMGTLGLVVGIAFFGKNPFNMMPIILGGFIYSRFMGVPFKNCILPAVLGTCLAPVVTQLAFVPNIPAALGLIIGGFIGLFIGFVINPVAAAMRKAHEGYNLYNVGFAAGLIGLCIFALFRNFGINYETANIWSNAYNTELAIFLLMVSAYFIACGLLGTSENLTLLEIINMDSEDHDYYKKHAEQSYVAMGLLGLFCWFFMLIVDGTYSGPIIGAILSVIGFGAFGKGLAGAIPVVAGAMIAAIVNYTITGIPANSSNFLLAALFSTCLSPLTRRFGVKWGIAAGFVHLSLATQVGIFHGGLNLYNNGFAGGLTAMVMLPLISFFEQNKWRSKNGMD